MYLNKRKDKLTLKNPTCFYPECGKCSKSTLFECCEGELSLCAFVALERLSEDIKDLANQIHDLYNDYRTTYKELYHFIKDKMTREGAKRESKTEVNL